MEYRYEVGGAVVSVRVERTGEGYAVTVDGQPFTVRVPLQRPGWLLLDIDGQPQQLAQVAAHGAQRWVALPGATAAGPFEFAVPSVAPRRRGAAVGPAALTAQMPGVVRRVLVAAGEAVERGQALVLLEAMKMEIRVTAPQAGVVRRVAVAVGQAVERGQTLIDVEGSDPGG